jgi:hypothetical protein
VRRWLRNGSGQAMGRDRRYGDAGNPIAAKVIGKMKRAAGGKLVDLRSVVVGHAAAEELKKQVVTAGELAGFHPAHAAYVYAQNQVSVMSEQLTALKEMTPFVDIVSQAENLYLPSGPPMSPLTTSYFTCWAFFDACTGFAYETIGTTILELGAAFGMSAELWRLIQSLQDSRMGLYIHRGVEGSLVVLEDIVTGSICRAISPAGYRGDRNELWYVRVLPSPIRGSSEHVAFTTPYIILQPDVRDWLAYFSRTFAHNQQARVEDYERHMKYGPTRAYWNEFVFEAYVNHRQEAIYLAGLPDVPESRPHSRM